MGLGAMLSTSNRKRRDVNMTSSAMSVYDWFPRVRLDFLVGIRFSVATGRQRSRVQNDFTESRNFLRSNLRRRRHHRHRTSN